MVFSCKDPQSEEYEKEERLTSDFVAGFTKGNAFRTCLFFIKAKVPYMNLAIESLFYNFGLVLNVSSIF